MSLNDIVSLVAEELNLPREVIDKTYKAYWNFIRVSLEELPLKKELSQEEFNKLRANINVPSLGKFNCTYNRYLGIKNRFKLIQQLRIKK